MAIITDPFDKIHQDLWAIIRPQREWIEKRGLFLIAGHFFSGIGAGAWLISWLLDFIPGLIASVLIVAIASGGAHLIFLGKPLRFWRMVLKPHLSWITRGLLSMAIFILFSVLYLLPRLFPNLWAIGSPFDQAMFILSFIGMVGILLYKGFVYAASKAIPFWNTPLLPALYIAYAIRGGAAVVLLVAMVGGLILDLKLTEVIKLWAVASTFILIGFYLITMSGAGVAPRRSVMDLLTGRISWAFYIGLVFLGLVIPLALGIWAVLVGLPLYLIGLLAISSLIGDFYVKYCVAKAGIYVPIIGLFPVRR